MILSFQLQHARAPSMVGQNQAFTLPEMMVSLSVCMLVMSGLITTHLFGLRLYQFTKPKLVASDNARTTIGHLVGELRNATRIRVGQGSLTTFTETAVNTPQLGNAIQVYATTNTTNFSRYYWDTDQKLKRMTNGSTHPEILSNSISNRMVFTSEDYAGNVLSNNTGNRVIGVTLQFTQIEYPIMRIGPNEFYDFYQLRTKITQRKFAQP